MRTWDNYKEYVKEVDSEIAKDIQEIEEISSAISVSIEQRFTPQH